MNYSLQIPGYRIISKIAEGGMATVYLGIQEKLNRKVAIKVLEPSLLKNRETPARFDKEAKTAAMLSHSNVIQIFDTGTIDDFHYIIMEYLQDNLKERMMVSSEGKLSPEKAIDIILDIMKALDYAHLQGVYHRDIKPDNIMFRQDNTPVLVDFGIARVFDTNDQLTKDGMSMGTVHYMSPEQCKAEQVDGRSDIYSLGIVFYEMLTGSKPYDGESIMAIVIKQVKSPVPTLPDELSQYQPLIDAMVAKNIEERISNSAQFREILDDILKKSVMHHTPEPLTPGHKPQPASSLEKTLQTTAVLIPNSNETQEAVLIPNSNENKATVLIPSTDQNPTAPLHKTPIPTLSPTSTPIPVSILQDLPPQNKKNQPPHFNKSHFDKLFLYGAITIAACIIIALFFLLKPGKNSNTKPSLTVSNQTSTTSTTAKDPILPPLDPEKEKEFREKYRNALKFLEKDDYISASILLDELTKMKNGDEVETLKKKIQKIKDKEFNEYLNKAYQFFNQKEYFKAKMSITQAKQIKSTPELEMLENNIDQKLKNNDKN